jgi:hypothetical protein
MARDFQVVVFGICHGSRCVDGIAMVGKILQKSSSTPHHMWCIDNSLSRQSRMAGLIVRQPNGMTKIMML